MPVLKDDPNNVVLNFIKWNFGCHKAKCWLLNSESDPNKYFTTFKDAWNGCGEPDWLLWSLDRANSGFDTVTKALNLACAAIEEAYDVSPLYLIGAGTKKALNALQTYLGRPLHPAGAALGTVKLSDLQYTYLPPATSDAGYTGSIESISPRGRASWAVVYALQAAVRSDILVADRAMALAYEAVAFDVTNAVDRDEWDAKRSAAADSIRTDYTLTDPLIEALNARYKNPPPWSKNTVTGTSLSTGGYGGGTINQPTAGSTWSGTSGKGYEAYGSDNNTNPQSRSAWVSDANGNVIVSGNWTTPPATYDWAYTFTGLTTGQHVYVNVQWTYSNMPTATQNDPCTVG
jgi:hypothetical protein